MRTPATMSNAIRSTAALALLLTAASPLRAENPKVKIAAANVGLPSARPKTDRDAFNTPPHFCKFAAWAPVFVDLQVLEPVDEPLELVIETPDADAVTTSLAVPIHLNGVKPGTELRAGTVGPVPYLRPAGGAGETTVFIRSASGTPISEPFRIRNLRPRDPLCYNVLALGARLPGFDLPKPTSSAPSQQPTDAGLLRNGKVELTAIADFEQLPDQWFGYEAADLIVLPTANAEFLDRLFGEKGTPAPNPKREALLEWVRRGGRIVVSIGANAASVVHMTTLKELLPALVDPAAPSRTVSQLSLQWADRESGTHGVLSGQLYTRSGQFAVANLSPKPGRGRIVIPPPERQSRNPVTAAVQGSFGLGRVTAVAFDIESAPFPETPERLEFWDWVLRGAGAARASIGNETKLRSPFAAATDEEDELTAALRTRLDTFDDVPVISFSWVAVFIVLYILLIGPVEYYFLKKVLGRLELTWITFPIIVLTVCTAVYFAAYAVKGRELKINKVDVVEVVAEFDSTTGQPIARTYGTTWFTIFSPRIATYTIGVTPNDGWSANPRPAGTAVSWFGGPQSGRAGLVRRRYSYHVEGTAVADGLVNVPVQVWSTKSFSANWAAEPQRTQPIVESRLVHPPGANDLVVGTFVNRMPFARIEECMALYGDKAYPLDTILPGMEVRLVLDPSHELPVYKVIQDRSQLAAVLGRGPTRTEGSASNAATGSQPTTTAGGTLPLWGVLFHELALKNEPGVYPSNASLRRLDQSWRLNEHNRDEVIVVGRVVSQPGPARDLFQASTSPTALWLKGLPQAGEPLPEVPGSARQETSVRLYLAVKPAGSK